AIEQLLLGRPVGEPNDVDQPAIFVLAAILQISYPLAGYRVEKPLFGAALIDRHHEVVDLATDQRLRSVSPDLQAGTADPDEVSFLIDRADHIGDLLEGKSLLF